MPLVLATSGQMVRCPQSWGVPETATVQDVMGKVIMLEKVMSDNIKSQQEHMNLLRQEILTVKACESKTPTFPGIRVTEETPSKKRKVDDEAPQVTYQSSLKPATYSSAAIRGVQSLDDSHQRGFHLLHQLVNDKQKQQPTSPRNICFGSAKNSGSSLSENTAPLSADVHLVASGVGKGLHSG